jgi:hypothetical protein
MDRFPFQIPKCEGDPPSDIDPSVGTPDLGTQFKVTINGAGTWAARPLPSSYRCPVEFFGFVMLITDDHYPAS